MPCVAAAGAAAFVRAVPAPAQDLGSGRWIDLTHPFNDKSVYWPTAETFELEEVFHGHTEGGWYYTAYNFSAAEHGGTHLDSPIHFAEGGADRRRHPGRADDRPGLRDRRERGRAEDVDYRVSAADIEAFEAEHGQIPQGGDRAHRHLVAPGSMPTARLYMGTAERGPEAVAKLHFPGLGKDGAEAPGRARHSAWSASTRRRSTTASRSNFETHVALMTNDIPAFENVADMSALPPTGATIVALPMKIEGGSGGPLRIVAHLPE